MRVRIFSVGTGGFSLIELLVSISIVSILMSAAFAILRPQDYFARARDSRRVSDLKVVQTALEQYYANNNGYPTVAPTFGSSWSPGGVVYLRMAPDDPDTSKHYCYESAAPTYLLCTNMETSTGTSGICNGTTYNYCLNSPF